MRTYDPTVHNYIANHPAVFPFLGGSREDFKDHDGWMLFGGAIAQTDRYVFLHNDAEDGGLIFELSTPGRYEMHSLFLPTCRGKRAIADGKSMIHEMFTRHGAEEIWGMTPISNRPARMFNRLCGASSRGRRDVAGIGECEIFGGFKDAWLENHWNNAGEG